MYKKIVCIALILGVSVMGFAENKQSKQATSDANKALIEQAVAQKHEELMGNLKSNLNAKEKVKAKKVNFGKANKETKHRFLFAGNTTEHMNMKKPTLKKVYNYLVKNKSKVSTDFEYFPNQVSQQPRISKGVFTCNTKGRTNTAVSKSGNEISDSKHDVTLKWVGKIVEKNGNYVVKNVKLRTITIEKDLTAEREKIKNDAENLIEGYYNDLETKNWEPVFEPEIATKESMRNLLENKSIAVKTDDGEINIDENSIVGLDLIKPNGQILNIKENEVPKINVYVDPTPYFTEDAFFYPEDVQAYYVYALAFAILLDNDLNSKISKVDYRQVGFNKPQVNEELLNMWKEKGQNANDLATNFKGGLENYVATINAKDREAIIKMFENKKGKVEVSHLAKDKENIKQRSVVQYIGGLRGKSLEITFGKRRIENGNINTIVYPFHQKYVSKKYTDCTDKELYIKYDEKTGKYVIDKVLVIEGSTKNCEE